ncbi:MAG: type II toxin-antitoxin system HicB family antitoxin [Candidatus Bathyarchaeota archaeon]
MKSFTAIIRKGEKQFVALCPEVDVVSQGYTIEEAVENLKEAVTLYLEEMGEPEQYGSQDTFVVKFEVDGIGKTSEVVR